MKNRLMKYLGRYLLKKELEDLHKVLRIERQEIASMYETVDNLNKEIDTLKNRLTRPPTKVVIRLTRGEYDRLKSQLQPNMVTTGTTQLEAAYLVGQQRVLDILEKGFVSDA